MKKFFKKFGVVFLTLLIFFNIVVVKNKTLVNAAVFEAVTSGGKNWFRYDDNDNNDYFVYCGFDVAESTDPSTTIYKKGFHISNIPSSTMKFKFYGTDFQIIGATNNLTYVGSKNISVIIDNNITDSFSCNAPLALVTTNYTKTGLSLGVHEVTIRANDSNWIWIDAIDLSPSGRLLPYYESLSIDETISLKACDSKPLVATMKPFPTVITWKSSNTAVATVDSNGKVTAIKNGQATITATTTDGSNISDSCLVTVEDPQTVQPTANRAILTINTASGTEKKYDLSGEELAAFLTWYNTASNGSGAAYYKITCPPTDPYKSKVDYIPFNKINDFEVQEYN